MQHCQDGRDKGSTSHARLARLVGLALLTVGGFLAAGQSIGCGASAADTASGPPESGGDQSTGVGQSGAQDFGRFRQIVEDGEVPDPETLDTVGWFNEHKFELPDPECGEDVCMHGMFGVQGNMIDGSNCTTVAVGFNTNRTPEDFKRPPLNLAIAIDTSGSMAGMPIESVRSGLEKMADELRPEDRVTLVTYSQEAQVVAESTPENDEQRMRFKQAVRDVSANGSTNLYRGLRLAFDEVDAHAGPDKQNRVILLSDGQATEGIQRNDRIVELGRSHARDGVGITTIGVGRDFNFEMMSKLSESGDGNFYFLEDAAAVEEVFVEEVQTFLVPLAEEIEIEFEGTQPYQFRAAYGTRNWTGDERSATIRIPALFMAGRESAEDMGPGGGRRGGGGLILLELVPTNNDTVLEETAPGHDVGEITMSYRDPETGETVEQSTSVTNPLKPDAAPDVGEFTSDTVEKGFVTLNLYAGFKMASSRATRGAAGAALDILDPLESNVRDWQSDHEDADIRADLELLSKLKSTLDDRRGRTETRFGQTPNPWPRD